MPLNVSFSSERVRSFLLFEHCQGCSSKLAVCSRFLEVLDTSWKHYQDNRREAEDCESQGTQRASVPLRKGTMR